ncbi:hypothetical protein CHS0354_023415 [Potamilus streckersoni]|uniref:Uncharacterized protein n=1 Tax=Potamilus streckersoni TaxID=2493646 RepID=A0AAE0VEJ5_9BIVA|nr:hypothetical protein CHS0354_023415 [Potamilus streckersoni]
MTRRNGSIFKIIVVAVVLLLAVYFVYLFNDISGRLKDTERSAERYRREHESVSAQLQVQFEHRRRLEKALHKEKLAHKSFTDDLNAAHEELRQRCDTDKVSKGCKQEYINRLNSLNQQHKMLKSQHDDMESEYGKLQQENNKLKQDQKQMEEQRNQEYMQLKQEKDLEISNFRDKIANMEREKDKLTKDLENIKAQLQNNMNEINRDQQTMADLQKQLQDKQNHINGDQQTMADLQKQLQDKQNQLILQQNIINQLKQQGVGQQSGFMNMQHGGVNVLQGGGANIPQGGGANVQQGGGANLQPLDGTFNQQRGAFHAQEVDLLGGRHDQEVNNDVLNQQVQDVQGILKDGAQNLGGSQNIAQNHGLQHVTAASWQHVMAKPTDCHVVDSNSDKCKSNFDWPVMACSEIHRSKAELSDNIRTLDSEDAKNITISLLGTSEHKLETYQGNSIISVLDKKTFKSYHGQPISNANDSFFTVHQQPGPNANDGQHQIAPPVDHNKLQGYQRKEDKEQQKQEHVGVGNIVPPEHENKQILKPNLDEVVDNNGGEEHNFHPAHVDGAADKQDPNAPKQVDLQVAPPKLGKVAQQPNQLPGHRDQGAVNFGQDDDDMEARNQKGPVEAGLLLVVSLKGADITWIEWCMLST